MGAAASAVDTVAARPNGPLLLDVANWSVDDVCEHLDQRGLKQYAPAVVAQNIDGAALLRFHSAAALQAPVPAKQARRGAHPTTHNIDHFPMPTRSDDGGGDGEGGSESAPGGLRGGLGVAEEHARLLAAELMDVRDIFHPKDMPAPELRWLCALRAGTGGGVETLPRARKDEVLAAAEAAAEELQAEKNAEGKAADRWYKDRVVGGPGGVEYPDTKVLWHDETTAQEQEAAAAEDRPVAVAPRWRKRRGWSTLRAQQGRGCAGLEVVAGHVIRLRLSGNNMEGVLPPGLGAMKRLLELRLDRNTLPGALPADIGACVALQHLDLSRCGLGTACQSALPGAALRDLTALHTLSLGENNLRGELPPELCCCTSLTLLDLSFNNFFGPFPKSLGTSLTRLVELRAFGNAFDGIIPSTLGSLSELVHLDLSDNSFRGRAPHDALVAGCRELRRIFLHSNYLKATEISARAFEERLPAANCVEVMLEPRTFTKIVSAVVEPEDDEEELAAAAAVAASLGMVMSS